MTSQYQPRMFTRAEAPKPKLSTTAKNLLIGVGIILLSCLITGITVRYTVSDPNSKLAILLKLPRVTNCSDVPLKQPRGCPLPRPCALSKPCPPPPEIDCPTPTPISYKPCPTAKCSERNVGISPPDCSKTDTIKPEPVVKPKLAGDYWKGVLTNETLNNMKPSEIIKETAPNSGERLEVLLALMRILDPILYDGFYMRRSCDARLRICTVCNPLKNRSKYMRCLFENEIEAGHPEAKPLGEKPLFEKYKGNITEYAYQINLLGRHEGKTYGGNGDITGWTIPAAWVKQEHYHPIFNVTVDFYMYSVVKNLATGEREVCNPCSEAIDKNHAGTTIEKPYFNIEKVRDDNIRCIYAGSRKDKGNGENFTTWLF